MSTTLKNLAHCPCARNNLRVLDEKAAGNKQGLNHWRRESD